MRRIVASGLTVVAVASAAAVCLAGLAAITPIASAHEGAPFVTLGVALRQPATISESTKTACAGVDEGQRPLFRHFACLYYFDKSYLGDPNAHGWEPGGTLALHSMPPTRKGGFIWTDGRFFDSIYPIFRRRQFVRGRNPSLLLFLTGLNPATVKVTAITRPTRRISVHWTVLCAKDPDRPRFFSQHGEFIVSRRGQSIVEVPPLSPGCIVGAFAQAAGAAQLGLTLEM